MKPVGEKEISSFFSAVFLFSSDNGPLRFMTVYFIRNKLRITLLVKYPFQTLAVLGENEEE